jgi:hypothetical protein
MGSFIRDLPARRQGMGAGLPEGLCFVEAWAPGASLDNKDPFGKYHQGQSDKVIETAICFRPGNPPEYLRIFSCSDHSGPEMR